MPGPPLQVPGRRLCDRSGRTGVDRAGRRRPARGRNRGQDRPQRRPHQPRPRPAGQPAPPIRPGRRGRDLSQPVPPVAQGQPPRPRPGQTAETQSQPGLAIRQPLRRAPDEQRVGERDPRLQARREDQRLLADSGNPATPLPHPLLPHQRPQPRSPPPGRHSRRPGRNLLDATNPNMIN
jgi:hypothetical protein